MPAPASPLGIFKPTLDPTAHAIPDHRGLFWRQIGHDQPHLLVALIPARKPRALQAARLLGKAIQHQAVPTLGAALARLRNVPAPFGRKWPCLLIRMNGCQQSSTILPYSQGAYKPRSLITITVQCSGTLPANFGSLFIQCGSHAPFCSAPTTFHATGMAQPRYTTLITSTRPALLQRRRIQGQGQSRLISRPPR